MSFRQWFNLGQQIDSVLVHAVALTSFYFKALA